MLNRLQSLVDRYEELSVEMSRPELNADYERLQTLAKERASLEEIVSLYRRYRETEQGLAEARALLDEAHDPEMEALAREELERLTPRSSPSSSTSAAPSCRRTRATTRT